MNFGNKVISGVVSVGNVVYCDETELLEGSFIVVLSNGAFSPLFLSVNNRSCQFILDKDEPKFNISPMFWVGGMVHVVDLHEYFATIPAVGISSLFAKTGNQINHMVFAVFDEIIEKLEK